MWRDDMNWAAAELHVAAAALVAAAAATPNRWQHLRQRPITCNEMSRDQSILATAELQVAGSALHVAAAATPQGAAEPEAAAVIM